MKDKALYESKTGQKRDKVSNLSQEPVSHSQPIEGEQRATRGKGSRPELKEIQK